MADDVEMTPVEMTPVDAAEPPKADPLAKTAAPKPATLKLDPVTPKPAAGGDALKPGLKLPPKPAFGAGLKLPPKPGAGTPALRPGLKLPTQNALKPGLKLPTQNALKPGLKLPPKPGATVSALKPGLKLPPKPGAPIVAPKPAAPSAASQPAAPAAPAVPKPGATQTALKPGIKPPVKPVIRKPGEASGLSALPKPVIPKPITPAPAAAAPAAPAAEAKPAPAPAPATPSPAAPAPVAVDAQGVGKLPTVEAKAIARDDVSPVAPPSPSPIEQLKSVTQKLKGVTQEIPQQAILRKTGIIAEDAMSEAQKAAAKHKTARISLSDAMGVAPVKNENAPLKTIRIKRPTDLPSPTAALKPQPMPPADDEPVTAATIIPSPPPAAEAPVPASDTKSTVTQRKTLKIARPGGAVRPAGKFGIKRPASTSATTVAKMPAAAPGGDAAASVADIPDIADIPDLPAAPQPNLPKAAEDNGSSWVWTLSAIVQFAACVVIGVLAWFLYTNTQTQYF